ncbi:unnamed protein product [marine sediment metagenome]|uniref:Uncharacterized protein n=1 Tax=marine sediment metagenome TaxID=412755 RepID=X1SZU3_9ZZZZ
MASGQSSKIAKLVDILMGKVAEVADDDDWAESDGWVGKWTIYGENSITRIYAIKDGKFYPTGEHVEYTGQVEMSEDTFLDLVEGALHGHGEDVFAQKYAARAIRYRGDQWIVDSERFRKVLRRISGIPLRSLR